MALPSTPEQWRLAAEHAQKWVADLKHCRDLRIRFGRIPVYGSYLRRRENQLSSIFSPTNFMQLIKRSPDHGR